MLDPATERITSALPDFQGRIWFVSKKNGKVGTLDPKTGEIAGQEARRGDRELLRGRQDGVYIVSDKRMYRFKAGGNGRRGSIWKAHYQNSGIVKPSQVNAGSGTTPTIMNHGYVAITDNADPMNVVVYRTANKLHGAGAHGLRAAGLREGRQRHRELAITAGPLADRREQLRLPGPVRPELGRGHRARASRASTSSRTARAASSSGRTRDVRAPTVVPKLSTKTGLIYAYTPPDDPPAQGCYWTAIDFRTGKTVWSSSRARASASTTTTPGSRSAPTGPPTWGGRPDHQSRASRWDGSP